MKDYEIFSKLFLLKITIEKANNLVLLFIFLYFSNVYVKYESYLVVLLTVSLSDTMKQNAIFFMDVIK